MEPPIHASTGVRLSTSPLIERWRDAADAPSSSGAEPAATWFRMLEAVSVTDRPLTSRTSVSVARLADAMRVDRKRAYGSPVIRSYDDLWRALDVGGGESYRTARAPIRLYQQARVWTFLHYRDGFIRFLEQIPFTAEAAVHGYTRVVMEWARYWPGLVLATEDERSAALDSAAPEERQGRHRRRIARTSRVALPLIVRQDLGDLLRLAVLESSDIGSTQNRSLGTALTIEALLSQIAYAASHIVEDATLTSLTAANIVRSATNDVVGGALMRLRIRDRDVALIESRLLEEVRRMMLAPQERRVTAGQFSAPLAELERQFAALRVTHGLFRGGHDD